MAMEQFGKWEQSIQESFNTQMSKHNARFEGWRAALGWVLKQHKRSNRGSIGIVDWIDKELKGNT